MHSNQNWVPSTLCYVEYNQQYLMMHRNKNKDDVHLGKWNGLGGKLNHNEDPLTCVKREVYEESKIQIQSPQLRGIMNFPNFKMNEHWLVFLYTATSSTNVTQENHEGGLSWIPKHEILNLELWEGDRYFLRWILDNTPFFHATFCYENKKLISHTYFPESEI